MAKYFIETKKKTNVTDKLFGLVERWDVIKTIEYPSENEWRTAIKKIGIPDVCWLIQDDIMFKAYRLD